MAIESAGAKTEQEEAGPILLLQESGALLFGEFTLSSGKKSDYYFDSKRLTMEPAGAYFVARQLVDQLDKEGIEYVGGVAYGAIPIVSHIVMFTGLRGANPIRAFYHRKDYKEHGTGAVAEGQFPPQGEPVAIVEDVVTTGGIAAAIHTPRRGEWLQRHPRTDAHRPGRRRAGGNGGRGLQVLVAVPGGADGWQAELRLQRWLGP